MKISISRQCDIVQTPRVLQIAGMFDVPVQEKSRVDLRGELPLEERPWNVGLIVGPSGSGKTTVARELFGAAMVNGFEWPEDRSLLDGFPDGCGIKDVTAYLTAVGFGTVPNWLRPFRVLSNGEQFRATVARALSETNDLVVIDEFTSVVDRQVAQVASHSVQKTIRRAGRQLVPSPVIMTSSSGYSRIGSTSPTWRPSNGGLFDDDPKSPLKSARRQKTSGRFLANITI